MTVKKIVRIASVVLLIAVSLPASSAIVVPATAKTNNAATTNEVRTQVLLQRLESIRSMDKSEMSRLEKKNLRNEVKEIKKEMKATSGGVYLSVGAIIIVILLLILLL